MSDEQKQNEQTEGYCGGGCCGGGCEEKESCKQCDQYLQGWQRALADYDNLKKELSREREGMRRAAKEDAAESLIPILDHFDQAIKYKPEGLDKNAENWLVGMLHVRNQLEQVLRELGVEPFGDVGEVFDPNKHEAVEEKEDGISDNQTILEVSLRGWKMGDRIIRPAKVIVNK